MATLLQPIDLTEVRLPLKCFVQAVFVQRLHAKQASLPANILSRLAVECHFANRRIHSHQFMYSDSPAEAGVVAVAAPLASHEGGSRQHLLGDVEVFDFALGRSERLNALGAVSPCESLSEYGHDARSYKERLDMHID